MTHNFLFREGESYNIMPALPAHIEMEYLDYVPSNLEIGSDWVQTSLYFSIGSPRETKKRLFSLRKHILVEKDSHEEGNGARSGCSD